MCVLLTKFFWPSAKLAPSLVLLISELIFQLWPWHSKKHPKLTVKLAENGRELVQSVKLVVQCLTYNLTFFQHCPKRCQIFEQPLKENKCHQDLSKLAQYGHTALYRPGSIIGLCPEPTSGSIFGIRKKFFVVNKDESPSNIAIEQSSQKTNKYSR